MMTKMRKRMKSSKPKVVTAVKMLPQIRMPPKMKPKEPNLKVLLKIAAKKLVINNLCSPILRILT
jgi:hypothetical protein